MRLFDVGARDGQQRVHDRWLTAPNAITAARLLGLPAFVWLVLAVEALAAALVVLVAIAATDWVDGYVARRFDQVSRVGAFIDPLVDRLLVMTVAVTLLVAGILPPVVVAAVLLRDSLVVAGTLLLFGGVPPITVTRTGKTATALLLVGLPVLMLAAIADAEWLRFAGYGLTGAGIAAYYGAGVQYARAALRLRRRSES